MKCKQKLLPDKERTHLGQFIKHYSRIDFILYVAIILMCTYWGYHCLVAVNSLV